MKIEDLSQKEVWNRSRAKKRFLNSNKKHSVGNFNPTDLPRKRNLEDLANLADELSDRKRIQKELNNQSKVNNRVNKSSYQYLVLKYGILSYLVREPDKRAPLVDIQGKVHNWESELIEDFSNKDFEEEEEDEFYLMAKAVSGYPEPNPEIIDSELNLIDRFIFMKNKNREYKTNYYTWMDFFERLGSKKLQHFPKLHDPTPHSESTIKTAIFGLQEQALVYDIDVDGERTIGIPEEFVEPIKDWLNFELVEEDYEELLNSIDLFDDQDVLIEIGDIFSLPKSRSNDDRRKFILENDVLPSDAMKIAFDGKYSQLQDLVKDDPAIDISAKKKASELINAVVNRYEGSHFDAQKTKWELYLQDYRNMAHRNYSNISPSLKNKFDPDKDKKDQLDNIFEVATKSIFQNVFGWDATKRGQGTGREPDGVVEFDGGKLMWDNKATSGEYSIKGDKRAIKEYIRKKGGDEDLEVFLIITSSLDDSIMNEIDDIRTDLIKDEYEVEIPLIEADDIVKLARYWISEEDREGSIPQYPFKNTTILDFEKIRTHI